jgi:hypothetical protein
MQRKPFGFLGNLFTVGIGLKSWVGYSMNEGIDSAQASPSRKGILSPSSIIRLEKRDPETIRRLNLIYAKDYRTLNDLRIVWLGLRDLGN